MQLKQILHLKDKHQNKKIYFKNLINVKIKKVEDEGEDDLIIQ